MSTRSGRYLMAVWDGGGNAAPQLAVGRRLVERGHQVHVLGDRALAGAAEAAGCTFSPWQRGTEGTAMDGSESARHDWVTEEPLDVVRNIRDVLQSGTAAAFAADTAAAIATFQPDAVVPDSQLFGVMIAAEEAGLPVAALVPNLWMAPTPGTGDPGVLTIINRVLKKGLPDLNAARADRGLPPLADFNDQLFAADRILVLSSETLDTASPFLPANVHYVGPILDDPVWIEPWTSPWPESNKDPLVLVGFSTIYQNQGPLLQRVVDALSVMEVRAAVALGRAMRDYPLQATDNVAVARSIPHTELLKEASLVVSHCGHGTTVKTLAAGVPMVCIPMGRDQDGTAACVVAQGAGVQLPPTADTAAIGAAVAEVFGNGDYRSNAQRMADVLAHEHQPLEVVVELEQLIAPTPPGAP
jgi:MGT family glycosyltransferase